MEKLMKILDNSIVTFFLGGITGYLLDKLLDLFGKILKGIPIKRREKLIHEYSDVIQSNEFIDYQRNILMEYYGEDIFTEVFNKKYPVFCIKGNLKYPFNELCEAGFEDDKKIDFEKNKFYRKYRNVVSHTIHRPKMQGFMLDEFILDNENKIIGMKTWAGTYDENVYTSHILEYELFESYKKYKKQNKLIIKNLTLRDNIHQNKNKIEDLYKGKNRASLLGVQMLIVFKDYKTHKYQVLAIKRSEDVAAKPGFYQFVPSGGFEVFENSEEHDKHELRENYNVMWAIYREYLEELILGKENEYEYGQGGETIAKIERDANIEKIINYISNGKAKCEFLGSVVDLCSLRNELSFVLRIDDEEYSKEIFKSNSESKKINRYFINELESEIDVEKINPSSAALWKLFAESNLYKEISDSK